MSLQCPLVEENLFFWAQALEDFQANGLAHGRRDSVAHLPEKKAKITVQYLPTYVCTPQAALC